MEGREGLHKSLLDIRPSQERYEKRCDIGRCVCCRRIFPQRYIMTLLMVFGLTIAYMQRVGLNLAIVEMVDTMQATAGPGDTCPRDGQTAGSNQTIVRRKISDRRFNWSEEEQGYILLSFYIGYLIGNIPIGIFTDKYGARWFVLIGMALSTVSTALIPLLAIYTHWATIVLSRVVAGLGQSTLFPAASSLISAWIPANRKSSIASIVMTSFTLGTILGNVCTGYLIEFTNSWSWVYYTYGIVGSVWLAMFYIYVYSTPYQHPRITTQELNYLKNELEETHRTTPPLMRMLKDMAIWTVIIGQFGNDYTLYTIITNMPKYFTTVLNYDVQKTGTLLMLPPATAFFFSFIFGFTADACLDKRIMKRLYFRVLCSIISMPLSSACMIVLTYMKCNRIGANIMLCLAMGIKAAYFNGIGVMAMDLSKNYSGVVFGWANASGSLAGMVAPYVIAVIAKDNSFPRWLLVQYISTILSIISLIPYFMFAKASRKPWDYTDDDKEQPPPPTAELCTRIWSCYQAV